MARISSLGGVPILYDRHPPENYGKTGFPYRPEIDEGFGMECEICFSELFSVLSSEFGLEARAILCGGVAGPGHKSYHATKRAFDLDGILFEDAPIWVADSFKTEPMLYLAVESGLRRSFGTVLGQAYSDAHHNHIHFDNGTAPGFNTMSKSRVLFVQNCLFYLFDQPLAVDGVYGPDTRDAVSAVRAELGLGGFSEDDNWQSFLDIVAEVAGDKYRVARALFAQEETS